MLKLLIKAPWWVGISGAVILFIASVLVKESQPGLFLSMMLKYFAAVSFLCGIISFLSALVKGDLFNKTNSLPATTAVNWEEFESLVGEYYRRKGYSVFQLGGDAPDEGIDLLAKKKGEKLVIQCKYWKALKVDVKIASELYGVMLASTASGAVLITSGDFTRAAIDFVKDKPIELIAGPELARLLAEARAAAQKPAVPGKSRAVLISTEPPPLKKVDEDFRP